MNISSRFIHPSGQFCFGRDEFCMEVANLAFQRRSFLLFGGRQVGKTTVLLRIDNLLGNTGSNVKQLHSLDIPVYVDLMRLPYDATPNDFWLIMAQKAYESCQKQVFGFKSNTNIHPPISLNFDLFIAYISTLIQYSGNVEVRFLFLVDEAKRVLGERFPRGFLDNIFSLLYGGDSTIGSHIAIVFAGAQELYKFFEDNTSPLASRAGSKIVPSLNAKYVIELTNQLSLEIVGAASDPKTGELIHRLTGGHAGLSARFAQQIAIDGKNYLTLNDQYVQALLSTNLNLFRIWADALSEEARIIQELLILHGQIETRIATKKLKEARLDFLRTERAIEELQFMGLIALDEKRILPVNEIYWNYITNYIDVDTSEQVSKAEKDIWNLIEQVELSFRELVRRKYSQAWPNNWINRIKSTFSVNELESMERIQQSSSNYYPLSPKLAPTVDILDMLYLGQLMNIMISSQGWQFFKHMFRDKRAFQDMVMCVTPVRNDRAHFRQVPQKELDRCRIACDDLLVIIERESAI